MQTRLVDNAEDFEGLKGAAMVPQGCWVRTATQKTGAVVKDKFIGRRSEGEAQFLGDLVEWIINSGVRGKDRLFTRLTVFGRGKITRKELTGRMVRERVKEAAALEGLNPEYFSAHSLRKGATTHMSARGVSEADILDRGNYAAGSEVPRVTYDYSAAGHGPLSSNSLPGGKMPGVADVKRHVPRVLKG